MATIYSLVCENGSSGSYWSSLSATDRLRYGAAGSERVYDGIISWHTARSSVANSLDVEILEIGDAFTDVITSSNIINMPSAATVITSMVNGQRSPAFHSGVVGSGYKIQPSSTWKNCFEIQSRHVEVNGVSADIYYGGDFGFKVSAAFTTIKNCIVFAREGQSSNIGYDIQEDAYTVENCIALQCSHTGFRIASYKKYSRMNNNLATKCAVGFSGNAASGAYYNNCSVGNTTNWGDAPSSADIMTHNVGESGDSIWDTDLSTVVAPTSASFVETFAGWSTNNFMPASGSVLIGSGTKVFEGLDVDLAGSVRPNYNPSGEESWDIGPFEYDHGNGLAPVIVTLEITNIVSGSELAIYKASDNSVIVAPQTVAETSYSTSYTYTADTLVNIVLRNASGVTKYQPYKTQSNITANGLSVYVSQVEDIIAQ